ncbi:hypothetical protein [Saprospira grandis]|uniref:hypothetical protein n=1 Tax=Saprospira grandis TaxID=1008 RepID=UPI0022DD9A0A|nr:hypothetical protein [Saprospira grandis]WBM74449.1 hypothetical protein OP864_15800 [Saprospira grandis]
MKIAKGYVNSIGLSFSDEKEDGTRDGIYKEEILIEQCVCRGIYSALAQYQKRIVIKDSMISTLDLYAAHLYGGLTIINSVIGGFRLMDGGHNSEPIIIRNCVFLGEVNFEETLLDSDIIIEDCIFLKGHDFVEDIGYAVMKDEYFKVKI